MTARGFAVAVLIAAAPVAWAAASSHEASGASPRYTIVLRIDPDAGRLEGAATIRLPPGRPRIVMNPGLDVHATALDGGSIAFSARDENGRRRVDVDLGTEPTEGRLLRIEYGGAIDRRNPEDGAIRRDGVFLPPAAGWYPALDGLGDASFRVETELPAGWTSVSESASSVDGVHLLAGPWAVVEQPHPRIELRAFVAPGNEQRARTLLRAAGRHVDVFGERFGDYPYRRLSLVETFFPSRMSMPSMVVAGAGVWATPGYEGIPLAHDVAHQWWGNGVRVAPGGGNWSEGLAALAADHDLQAASGPERGRDARRKACLRFEREAAGGAEALTLAAFHTADSAASETVGRDKGMMLFHMLRRRIGRSRFDATLRALFETRVHRTASWNDVANVARETAGEDLDWFFEQWVGRAGAPDLRLEDVRAGRTAAAEPPWEVRGRIVQRGVPWRVRVPLVFQFADRSVERVVEVDGAVAAFRIGLPGKPVLLELDPDHDVLRSQPAGGLTVRFDDATD